MSPRAEVRERLDPQDALVLDESTLDPNLHYRFVHPRNMAKRKAQGYEVVLRSETKVRLLSDDERLSKSKTADDLIRIGNTVLMACHKKRYKERREAIARLARERLGSSEARFQSEARKRGVRSITDEGG